MYHVSAQGVDERMINVHYYHSKLPCVRYVSVPSVCLEVFVCLPLLFLKESSIPAILCC